MAGSVEGSRPTLEAVTSEEHVSPAPTQEAVDDRQTAEVLEQLAPLIPAENLQKPS